MGRMKEQLGEAPVTIGRARAYGAIAVLVSCNPPCRRKASVKLDALRLPNDTSFSDIATLKRFVCEDCGRRATTVEVDWDAKAESPFGTWGMPPPGFASD